MRGRIVLVDIVEGRIRWNERGLCDGVNGRFAGTLDDVAWSAEVQ